MKYEALHYDKAKLLNEFKNFSIYTHAYKNKILKPSYSTVYGIVTGKQKMTIDKLQSLCDMMNREHVNDGFTVKRVKPYSVSDFLL